MWERATELACRLRKRRKHHRIWRAARHLSTRVLQREDASLEITLDDLLAKDPSTPRFLSFYTRQGLESALRAYGFTRELDRRGFTKLRVDLSNEDRFTSTLRCFASQGGSEHLLCETRCRFQAMPRPRWLAEHEAKDALTGNEKVVRIEWMMLQNPCASFSADRPRLPGQEHPGLGLGQEVMEILRVLGWRLRVAAFDVNPIYVHNAVLYARQFSFVEPEDHAFFLAVTRLARGRTLQDLGKAVHGGFLEDADTGKSLQWPSKTQISPLARPLVRLYRSERYSIAVSHALSQGRPLRIDWPAFDGRMR